jgi:hypothetical protein
MKLKLNIMIQICEFSLMMMKGNYYYYNFYRKILTSSHFLIEILFRRDLQSFLSQQDLALLSVDADRFNGELTIKIPHVCDSLIQSKTILNFCMLMKTFIFFIFFNRQNSI